MPLTPINYANTIIYRIFSDNCDYVYVGSTTDITRRRCDHKRHCNTETNKSHYKVYQTIRENGGWNEFKMLEIEEYPCENSKQAQKREQYWIDHYKANLNSRKSFGGETKQESKKQYILEHKDEKKAYDKIRRTEYAEEIKQKKAEYYKLHKEELNQKFTCECGAIVTKQYLSRHKKTKKHLEAL